jgi:hypothetical protein
MMEVNGRLDDLIFHSIILAIHQSFTPLYNAREIYNILMPILPHSEIALNANGQLQQMNVSYKILLSQNR